LPHQRGYGVITLDKWDERWMNLAKEVSTWSKDPSTKVGAIIANGKEFIMLGYNGFPNGIEDDEARLSDRSKKYPRVIHAEPNAIIKAKRDLSGASIYTYPFAPCSTCAALIINSGIVRAVAPILPDNLKERWGDSLIISREMFEEAGVKFEEV
jgi:dCMP deaminase